MPTKSNIILEPTLKINDLNIFNSLENDDKQKKL